MRNTLGTYTPNYNLYMPSIGEQGWGELVSNNFEILDTIILNNLNDLQTQIDTINTNIGDGTRILSISSPPITITTSNFSNYASYDSNNVYIAQFRGENVTFESIPQPSHSCRLMIISVKGNATFSGNIDTYPTTLQSETPPNTPETNTYANTITLIRIPSFTLTYTANANNSQITIDYNDYLNFISNTKTYSLSIPHATAAGGNGGYNGTSGTATNTCNGGGGGYSGMKLYTGGTGCIFGQYAGGDYSIGYGYGSGESNKYRCGLVIVVNGNLTINESGTITQNGGDRAGAYAGGYGGGSYGGGGGGAPVFIYYTGTYTNNGTINTAGGNGGGRYYGNGGAGGIKTTKITL